MMEREHQLRLTAVCPSNMLYVSRIAGNIFSLQVIPCKIKDSRL